MPSPDLPRLVEEALCDIAPYDATGTLAAHIREALPALKRTARLRDRSVVNRAALALVVTGDPDACQAAAVAYGKALYSYDLTNGGLEGPVLKACQWRDVVADPAGNPLPFHKALDRLYAEKMEAEGGVLVIANIYDLPANATNATAVDQAKNGAYQMLHDLMTEFAEKGHTPVVVLTGEAAKMQEFLKNNRGVAEYFTAPAIPAASPPPPPMSVETDSAVTIRHPLKLKRPGL
jgi:hypothetical protein